jgi:hypothetical protein
MTRPLRIFTWHVHGSYLLYLTQAPHDFFVPLKPGRPHGYGGIGGPFPWPSNLHEVPVEELASMSFDCVLFQAKQHYLEDQYDILTPEQRALPRIYLEHDPPLGHPTDTRHVVDDPSTLLVHVTDYNALMWDSGPTPTRVIDHGVVAPSDVRYTGELDRGIAVVNHLQRRGRRLGADIFQQVRERVPIDLVGMAAEEMDGLGEVPFDQLHSFISRYRFFFNPIRYTSLGLAVCEAMMIGMPVVGLGTTEMPSAIFNGMNGYVSTNVDALVVAMRHLLRDPAEARRLGNGARDLALRRFNINRFIANWNAAFQDVTGSRPSYFGAAHSMGLSAAAATDGTDDRKSA